jgi:cyanate lyase
MQSAERLDGFGDGVMSAIDLGLQIEREPDPNAIGEYHYVQPSLSNSACRKAQEPLHKKPIKCSG